MTQAPDTMPTARGAANSDANYEQLAQAAKAAGDPLRLQILRVLQHNAYGVLELCDIFGIRQSGMSHHLKVLAKAGWVATRREGTSIYYRRNLLAADHPLRSFYQQLFSVADQLQLTSAVSQQVDRVHSARAEASRRFFAEHSEQLKHNQDLMANWDDYGDSVVAMVRQLAEAMEDANEQGRVLEIGPGDGDLLPTLAQRFAKVIAIDNAEPMLRRSHGVVADQTNVTFVMGDALAYCRMLAGKPDRQLDLISLNMVLHHIADPAALVYALAGALKPGGVVLITDLCEHDQTWVRESCGDYWLGFAPDDLTEWAELAGLRPSGAEFLTLRNGFRVQLRQFQRAA